MLFQVFVRRVVATAALLGAGLVVLGTIHAHAQEWKPAEGEVTVTIVAWDRFDECWPVIDVTPGYGAATPENENGNLEQLHAGPQPSVTVITAGEYEVYVGQEPQVRFLEGSIVYTVEIQWTDGDGTRHPAVEIPGMLQFPAGGVEGSLSGAETEMIGTLRVPESGSPSFALAGGGDALALGPGRDDGTAESSGGDRGVDPAVVAVAGLAGAAAVGVGGVSLARRRWRQRVQGMVDGWDADVGLPPLLHTVIDTGDASERWWRRHRRARRGINFSPELEGRINAYDHAAEQARQQAHLTREQELGALLREAPNAAPIQQGPAGDFHPTAPGAFGYGGMRVQLDWVNQWRVASGWPPMTPSQEADYRRWLNRYYSWWRRAAPHINWAGPSGNANNAAGLESTSAVATRG